MADFRKLPLKQFAKTQEHETPEGAGALPGTPGPPRRLTGNRCPAAKFWRRFEPRLLEKYVRATAPVAPPRRRTFDRTCPPQHAPVSCIDVSGSAGHDYAVTTGTKCAGGDRSRAAP